MTTPRKRVPESAPKPLDHQRKKSAAARKAEAEAADGYMTVTQCGMELKLPVGGNMPLDAILLFQGDEDALREYGIDDADADSREAKLNLAATKLMLGPEQWAAFREKRPTVADFNAIGEQMEELGK